MYGPIMHEETYECTFDGSNICTFDQHNVLQYQLLSIVMNAILSVILILEHALDFIAD